MIVVAKISLHADNNEDLWLVTFQGRSDGVDIGIYTTQNQPK